MKKIIFILGLIGLCACNRPPAKNANPTFLESQIEELENGKKLSSDERVSAINKVFSDTTVLDYIKNNTKDTLYICKNKWLSETDKIKIPLKRTIVFVNREYYNFEGVYRLRIRYRHQNKILPKFAFVLDVTKIIWNNELVVVELHYSTFSSNTFVLGWGPAWQILYVTPSYFT